MYNQNLSLFFLRHFPFIVKFRNLGYVISPDNEMANKDDVDVLFGIRNAFYAGNYQSCITEAQKIKKVLGDRVLNIGGH